MGQSGILKFFGKFVLRTDEKGRLVIPSTFRNHIKDMNIFISIEFEKSIVIRIEEDFNEWTKYLANKSYLDADVRALNRFIMSNSFKLKLDSKGRINIPTNMLEQIEVKNELVVVGVGDRMEIFSKQNWVNMNNKNLNSLELIAHKLLNKKNE